MLEALSQALATPGLLWIALSCVVGGVVRGFSGFGTALIVLPVMTQFIDPIDAIIALVVMDFFGPLPVMRQAIRDAKLPEVGRLVAGMVLMVPVGLSFLFIISPEVFRYSVSIISLMLLFCLIFGFRFHGTLSSRFLYGIGGLAGFTGGFAGVPGPPVILIYMASTAPVRVIRANSTIFLYSYDLFILASFFVLGQMTLQTTLLGLLLAFPVVLGNFVGGAMFRPQYERQYRSIAYFLIAASAISGLPMWND